MRWNQNRCTTRCWVPHYNRCYAVTRSNEPSCYVGCSCGHTYHRTHCWLCNRSRTHYAKRNAKKLRAVQWQCVQKIAEAFPHVTLHGIEKELATCKEKDLHALAPHILHIAFGAEVNHSYLAVLLDSEGFAVSEQSACVRETHSPFRKSGIRISFHSQTSARALQELTVAIKKVYALAVVK